MSVTAPEGFVAAGGAGGIKADGKADLALVATASRAPAPAAAVFTSNLAAAAPVRVSQEHLTSTAGMAAAVILNSGNANAATGPEGVQVARSMCAMTAGALGLDTEAVLVCSTGLIGAPLSLAPIQTALPRLVRVLGPDSASGEAAARAIMTTDTFPKQVRVDRPGFVVGGMAKGAAMLAPNMATMLAVLTTDAVLEPTDLQPALHKAVEESFNLLSIDGCTSTNDTVMVLTSAKGRRVDSAAMTGALSEACSELARQMAADAEGGTKVVTVRVTGARSDDEALRAARKVANSNLVKCSFYGEDPYWGRVVSELGSAGVDFQIDQVSVAYGGVTVCHGGTAVAHEGGAVRRHLAGRDVEVHSELGLGEGSAKVMTTDLSHGYIDENMRMS